MDEKWIQESRERMKRKGTVGSLKAIARREGGLTKEGKIKASWLRKKCHAKGKVGRKARWVANVAGIR